MTIQAVNKKIRQIKTDGEIIFVVNKKLEHKWVNDLASLKELNFKGKPEEVIFLENKRRIYIGVESTTPENLRIGVFQAVNRIKEYKIKSLKIGLYGYDVSAGAKAIVEGFILGLYNFQQYKSKKKKSALQRLIISTENYNSQSIDIKEIAKAIEEAKIVAQATNFTRDIVNQIPEEMTPKAMANLAMEMASELGIKGKVYGDSFLKKENMNAMLAVSKASPYPAQLIHLEYKPVKPRYKIAIVGKGLTYDTGGLSLKPSDSMRTMKMDKAGGSAVLGIIKVASELKLPIELHGIIGAVENAIGQHAYKPDDVLVAKNGKTIEVKNTDAEGRLVLADCLCYAQDLKPDYIIDLATLTGACMVALGEHTIGVMGHSRELKESMRDAAFKAGELTGNLPFNRYLAKLVKSEVADIANISSGRYGGAITAALFLSEFIDKKYKNKWLHLDIAGPAFTEKPWGVYSYGASGAGVRTVVEWLKEV